jgi:uncharacterized protein YndB with AHSA1/START domain
MPEQKPDLQLTRYFDAPRDLVFNAWTDPKLLEQWWGPNLFTNPECEVDAQPGGKLFIMMCSPDGTEYPCRGVFQEVVTPEKLVFTTNAFEDEHGNAPLENLNTVTFTEEYRKTTVKLRVDVLKSTPEMAEALAGMSAGWSQSFDKLTEKVTRLLKDI